MQRAKCYGILHCCPEQGSGQSLACDQLGISQHEPLGAFAFEVHLHPSLGAAAFKVQDNSFAE